MESLFSTQARVYAAARPKYPPQLFELLASLSKGHKRAWDVGTGNGQAAVGIAEYYEEVIATDTSEAQLRHAEKRPNISYRRTSAGPLSEEEVERVVGGEGSLDLITAAQSVQWLDRPSFYAHARRLLKPGGIVAVWCYTWQQVTPEVDAVLDKFCATILPYWEPNIIELVMNGYENLDFPFQPVLESQLESSASPIRMYASTKDATLEDYLGVLNSWSAVNTARAKGIELLGSEVKQSFEHAWGSPSRIRTVTFPLYARIGTPF